MQFERLRKSHKKEILIALIAVCVIGGAVTFATTRAFYRVDENIDLAKGTINYKAYDFKIMAMYKSDDKINYTEIEEMPSEGYTINEDKSYCNMSNGNKDTTAILKTINGNHSISKLKKNDRCYLYFDRKTTENVPKLIASLNAKTEVPDFSQTAETDEGVFIADDPMYGTNAKTYYWRGAVTNNYVKFANFCWRIIRINGDGTLRLIYDGSACHNNGESTTYSIVKTNIAYNSSANQSNYVGWTYNGTNQRTLGGTPSNAKTELDTWYGTNITGTNAINVAKGKYCNDRNVRSGDIWKINGSEFYYAAYERIKDHNPSLSCDSGDIYELNVGLITIDEAMYAGGSDAVNNQYYLYNGQSYWTMSPYQWFISSDAFMFYVYDSGNFLSTDVANTYYTGLRPVVNLRSDITFSSGDGTIDNPYIVS